MPFGAPLLWRISDPDLSTWKSGRTEIISAIRVRLSLPPRLVNDGLWSYRENQDKLKVENKNPIRRL